MTNTPASWYPNPDPARPGSLRYWDGTRWTEHVHPPVGPLAQVPARRSPGKLVAKIVVAIAVFFVLGVTLIVYLAVAVFPSSDNGGDARVSAVVSAVEAADTRVVSATVEQSVSGFGYGWSVDVVLSGDEPVTPEELSALLLAARHAGKHDPAFIYLFATSPSGASLDLTIPADELGLRNTKVGDGVNVGRDEIDDALSTGQ